MEIIKEEEMTYDFCLMNPPYLGESRNDYNIHLKFLNKTIEIANNVVSIQPIMFLFKTYDKKSPEKTEKEILDNIEKFGCNVEELTAKEFDALFNNKIGIININSTTKTDVIINGKKYNSTSEITKFSGDKLLTEFANKTKELYKDDSLGNHWCFTDLRNAKLVKRFEEDSKSDMWFVNVSYVRGNKGTSDMYTIIPKDRVPEIGKRTLKYYFNFNTKEEAQHFINYCKTDFASCCVYLYKHDMNLSKSLQYVPWFDFTDEHFSKTPREIDDWLFEKYNISDEIRKHIEEILPDYYGIRK